MEENILVSFLLGNKDMFSHTDFGMLWEGLNWRSASMAVSFLERVCL